MKNILPALFLLLTINIKGFSQSTIITAGPKANVQLPVVKNSDLLLMESPQSGMMVFDVTYGVVRVFDGITWRCVGCGDESYTNAQVATIESFTLGSSKSGQSTLFTALNLGIFKNTDNGIGAIKLGGKQPNGFVLDNQDVVVFESALPLKIQLLPQADLLNLINRTKWEKTSTYTQPVDIITESDESTLTFNVREAGEFEKKEATILGLKAYKFQNKVFIEKYSGFVNFIDDLITPKTAVNLYTAMDLNPKLYTVVSSSPWFAVNDGILTFPSEKRPESNYGVIYFIGKSKDLPNYRIRIFTHRPTKNSITKYYDAKGKVRNRTTYLNDYYLKALNANIPSTLDFSAPAASSKLKVADPDRPKVPPPTAGTEDGVTNTN